MARQTKKATSKATATPRDESLEDSPQVQAESANPARDDGFAGGDYPTTPTVPPRRPIDTIGPEESESEEGWSDDSGRHSDNFENESCGSGTPKSRSTGPPVLPTRSAPDPDIDRFSPAPNDDSSHTPHPKPRGGGLMGGFFSRKSNSELDVGAQSDGDDDDDDDDDDEDEDEDDDEPVQAIGGTYLSNNSTRSNRSSRSQSSNYSQEPEQFIAAPPLKRAVSEDSVEEELFEPRSPVSPYRCAPSPVNHYGGGDDAFKSPRSEDPPESPAGYRFGHVDSSPMSSKHSRSASQRETFDDEPDPSSRPPDVVLSPRGTGIAFGDEDHYAVASPLSTSTKRRALGGYRGDDDLEDHPSRSGSVVDSVAFSEAEKRHRKTVTRLLISLACALVCMAVMAGALVGVFVFGKGGGGGGETTTPQPLPPSNSNSSEPTLTPSASPVLTTSAPTVAGTPPPTLPVAPATLPPILSNLTGNLTEITNQALFNMLAALSADGGVAMMTAGTPQSQAFTSVQAENLGEDDARLAQQDSRLAQRYALRSFYYSTNGPSWTNKTGWEEAGDECLWYSSSPTGMCTDNVVQTLEFVNNNITGELPNELSMLTGMTKLSIKGVEGLPGLVAGIPDSLRSLSGMTEFVLQHHKMKGAVPGGMFDTWSAATDVSLADCNIPGILPDMSGLTSVVKMNLSGNRFRGAFPVKVTTLVNLEELTLADNKLAGPLPPSGLEALTKLKYFSVAGNKLTGANIAQFGSLVSLTDGLDLSKNSFSGGIPTELNQLTGLTHLLLSYNTFNGTVPDLTGLTKLKVLALEGNELTGTFPDGTCTALASADVSADCNPGGGGGEVDCSCCTKCCISTADDTCQSAR